MGKFLSEEQGTPQSFIAMASKVLPPFLGDPSTSDERPEIEVVEDTLNNLLRVSQRVLAIESYVQWLSCGSEFLPSRQ
jgi:hypothetical protein